LQLIGALLLRAGADKRILNGEGKTSKKLAQECVASLKRFNRCLGLKEFKEEAAYKVFLQSLS